MEYPLIKRYRRRIFIRYEHQGDKLLQKLFHFWSNYDSLKSFTLRRHSLMFPTTGSNWDKYSARVRSWASELMSPMVSRRQPIYRPACTADVSGSESAAHQSAATQRRLAVSWPASAPPPPLWLSFSAQVHFSSSRIIALWCSSHQRYFSLPRGDFVEPDNPFRKTLPKLQLSVFVWELFFFVCFLSFFFFLRQTEHGQRKVCQITGHFIRYT